MQRYVFGGLGVPVSLSVCVSICAPVYPDTHVQSISVLPHFCHVLPLSLSLSLYIYSNESIPAGFERKEHFEIVVQPTLDTTAHVVNGDFCIVQDLDMNAVSVISNIMAQTVALDSYADTVDELLAHFASINNTVKHTGNLKEKDNLFKVVAENNSLFIDLSSKLGIKDRSDTAWNLSQYDQVHQDMRAEFEIENRSEYIESKLELIQQNAKFFMEVMHNQKSNSLEWIIIILISFECILMVLEMSGLGSALLSPGSPPTWSSPLLSTSVTNVSNVAAEATTTDATATGMSLSGGKGTTISPK